MLQAEKAWSVCSLLLSQLRPMRGGQVVRGILVVPCFALDLNIIFF